MDRDVQSIAKCITENVRGTTEHFDNLFNQKGRYYVFLVEDGSYWNGQFWSLDHRVLNEGTIHDFGNALILAESMPGTIIVEHEMLSELRDILSILKSMPGNIQAMFRNWTGRFNLPDPQDDRDGFMKKLGILNERIKVFAEKSRPQLSVGRAFDLMVKQIMTPKGVDITDQVKDLLTARVSSKPGRGMPTHRRSRAYEPQTGRL